MKLLLGDCIDKLKELDDNSVDSIVTDPPYGLSFMGKKWDYDVPSQEIFEECLRVLKPGGHLLSFAGSRTYHRMAVRVEDAGFEIRDQIMWIYGSGFPKSHNIGKAVDKIQGNEREEYDNPLAKKQTGQKSSIALSGDRNANLKITKGNSEWEGWGTALKPAHEPIVMARKPLSEKTIVDNVLEWGTGGINIDDSRILTTDTLGGGATNGSVLDIEGFDRPWMHDEEKMKEFGDKMKQKVEHAQTLGRFPANVIHDGSDEVVSRFPHTNSAGKARTADEGSHSGKDGDIFSPGLGGPAMRFGDGGSASRFFYCPKTSKRDRNEGLDEFEDKQTVGGGGGIGDYKNDVNSASGKFGSEKAPSKNNHPTVKPTDLMLYLIRLVTPKGGTTLDPFMGSGSTGKAAVRGGFEFVGIEREEEYMEIAQARIQYEIDNPYNEETKTRTEVKSEVKETVNKFFSF